MGIDALDKPASRFMQRFSTSFSLDVDVLGDPDLAWWLGEAFGAVPVVTGYTELSALPGANAFSVEATLSWGPFSGVAVGLTFFKSWLAGQETDSLLEILIAMPQPIADTLPIDNLVMPIRTTPIGSPSITPSEQRRDAFFQHMTLLAPMLTLSSYDFVLAGQANAGPEPFAICNLDAERARTELAAGRVRGLNVAARLVLSGQFWTDLLMTGDSVATGGLWGSLAAMASPAAGLAFTGAIQIDDTTGDRIVAIRVDPDTEIAANLGFTSLATKVSGVTLRSGSRNAGGQPPTCAIELTFTDHADAASPTKMVLEVPFGEGAARLTGTFDPPLGSDWTGKLAAPFSTGALPVELPLPADCGIVALDARLSLPDLASGSVAVTLSSDTPWRIAGDVVEVFPWIQFGFEHGPGQTDTLLRLGGQWVIDPSANGRGTSFDVMVDVESTDVIIAMAQGETLDIDALVARLGIDLPVGLTLIDLEMAGNVRDKSYSFSIDAGAALSLPVPGGRSITLTDLQVTVDHDDGDTDWRIEALVEIAGAIADITVSDTASGGWAFRFVIDYIDIGAIADDLLAGLSLPPLLDDFSIENVVIDYTADAFDMQGESHSVVSPFDGFAFEVASFSLSRRIEPGQPAAVVDGALNLTLSLGDASAPTRIDMAGSRDSGDWLFSSKITSGPIGLDHLVSAMQQMAGLQFPLPHTGLAIDDVACRYRTGPGGDYWLLACKLVEVGADAGAPAKELGSLTYAAHRPAHTAGAAAPPWDYAVLGEIEIGLDFGALPVVGSRLPKPAPTVQAADLLIASTAMDVAAVQKLFANLPSGVSAPDTSKALPVGASLAIKVEGIDGASLSVSLNGAGGTPPAAPVVDGVASAPIAPTTALPDNDKTSWLPVGKTFGPLNLDRVGIRYHGGAGGGALALVLNASMTLGPVTVGFLGLGLSSPIDHFQPSPTLDGVSVAYEGAGVSIGGALLSDPDGYSGQLHLAAAGFNLTVLGRYSSDPENLVVFGMLNDPPLGGPPEFYVKGVAAGMGFNSALVLPASPADVVNFSLVKAAMPAPPAPFADGGGNLSAVLQALDQDCPPRTGETWLAGGVQFSSFELIESVVLLSIEFGGAPKLGLVGLSRAALPPDAADPVALFEVGLVASFDTGVGALKVDGALTPRSYVLSRDAHMSGGFGFYAWFKDGPGVHAGDFVYTMGGYHPQFIVPDHYPKPPRLSLGWQIGSDLSVKGSSYFALAPHCLMAGMSMEAVWSSGCISAWFDADADFLLYWKPFHYVAHIDTRIGASFTIDLLFTSVTLTVHVGMGLDVKGPPFGGTADIDLDVISFSISFGDDTPDNDPLTWPEFENAFLPPKPFSVQPQAGLIRDNTTTMADGDPRWVFSADQASLGIGLSIPAKIARFSTIDQAADSPNAPVSGSDVFAVAPMRIGSDQVGSELRLLLRYSDGGADPKAWPEYEYSVNRTPRRRGAPASLWGVADHVRPPGPNASALVPDLLTGFDIVGPDVPPDATLDVDLAALQFNKDYRDISLPLGGAPEVSGYGLAPADGDRLQYDLGQGVTGDCAFHVLQTVNAAATVRRDLINDMRNKGMLPRGFGPDLVSLDRLASVTVLDDWPMIRRLGEI